MRRHQVKNQLLVKMSVIRALNSISTNFRVVILEKNNQLALFVKQLPHGKYSASTYGFYHEFDSKQDMMRYFLNKKIVKIVHEYHSIWNHMDKYILAIQRRWKSS